MKPCRNCKTVKGLSVTDIFLGYRIQCILCGQSTAMYETKEEAERAWNAVQKDGDR